jgi:TRAP-type mannitol/chloroaromatic compound transport system permease small subunit
MITLPVYDKNREILMPPYAPLASKLDQGVVWLGRTVSWCVPIMAVLVLFIVVLRYGFNTGAIAAQESVQYLHAAIFMLGAAVALQADQHVRVDIFYRRFSARQQAWVNGLGHVVFTLPLCGLIGWGSWDYVMDSWSAREASPEPGGLPFVYLLKTLIPVMAMLLTLQALIHLSRALTVLRQRDSI